MNVYRHIEDLPSLEREYSPSSCVADVNVFVHEYARRSAQARDGSAAMRTVRAAMVLLTNWEWDTPAARVRYAVT